MKVSDENLMAYADGALPQAERARVAAAVMENPALRARLEALTRGANLAQAAMPLEDVPDALQQRIQATIAAEGSRTADAAEGTIVSLTQPAQSRNGLWFGAVAASLMLGFGIGLGTVLLNPTGNDSVAFDLTPFTSALDRAASGTVTQSNGIETHLIASFEATDGAFCREFEAHLPNRSDLIGVGCQIDGGWELRFAAATELPGDEQFVTASALETLDAWMRSTGAGPVLSIEEEAARLSTVTR